MDVGINASTLAGATATTTSAPKTSTPSLASCADSDRANLLLLSPLLSVLLVLVATISETLSDSSRLPTPTVNAIVRLVVVVVEPAAAAGTAGAERRRLPKLVGCVMHSDKQ
jgi:hypothetical protein